MRWRTLELHTTPGPALVQMAALRAAGFLSLIDNFNHASMTPYYAFALGGFRVVVLEEDWPIAQRFVACEDVAEMDGYEPIDVCLQCGSTDIFRGASLILSFLGLVTVAVPLPVQTDYRRCRRCANKWHRTPSQ